MYQFWLQTKTLMPPTILKYQYLPIMKNKPQIPIQTKTQNTETTKIPK